MKVCINFMQDNIGKETCAAADWSPCYPMFKKNFCPRQGGISLQQLD